MTDIFPLTLKDVAVRRKGKTVLGPVDFVLRSGGPTVMVGPNGSGKTTLLRVMHGIERIGSGSVTWAQDDPARHAFVFQSPIVMRRTVAENLAYPLRLLKRPKAQIMQDVAVWLDRIGLAHVGNSEATRLSGGERQKLAIARALIRKPDVLFLDEPSANLDGHATREIEALLLETAASGTQIVMATHDMGQVRRIGVNLVFMLGGKIHEAGPTKSAMHAPQTPALAAFLRGDIVT